MMDYDLQLKLQAWLDGELPAREVSRLEARLAKDAQAQALLAELKMTTAALAGFETGVKLPEPPEFFWSKIQRDIERQPKPVAAPRWAPVLAGWRRWLTPAGTLAAAVAAALLITRSGPVPAAETSLADTSLADSGAFTYYDFPARTTLVWFSYPADEALVASREAETMD
jgi:anti-sigma factor RsiW